MVPKGNKWQMVAIRGHKPGPSKKSTRARPGRASGRKVLIASGLVGPNLPSAFEFRLIYIIKTQLLCVCCVFVRPNCIKVMEEYKLHL